VLVLHEAWCLVIRQPLSRRYLRRPAVRSGLRSERRCRSGGEPRAAVTPPGDGAGKGSRTRRGGLAGRGSTDPGQASPGRYVPHMSSSLVFPTWVLALAGGAGVRPT
jgi:hypothetical protein